MQVKCRYSTLVQRVFFTFISGPLEARFGKAFPAYASSPIAGAVGCTETIFLSTGYPIAEPKPLFITH